MKLIFNKHKPLPRTIILGCMFEKPKSCQPIPTKAIEKREEKKDYGSPQAHPSPNQTHRQPIEMIHSLYVCR